MDENNTTSTTDEAITTIAPVLANFKTLDRWQGFFHMLQIAAISYAISLAFLIFLWSVKKCRRRYYHVVDDEDPQVKEKTFAQHLVQVSKLPESPPAKTARENDMSTASLPVDKTPESTDLLNNSALHPTQVMTEELVQSRLASTPDLKVQRTQTSTHSTLFPKSMHYNLITAYPKSEYVTKVDDRRNMFDRERERERDRPDKKAKTDKKPKNKSKFSSKD
uniref:Uncharacterized protein n=1 Tax=Panagrellus redivivus TaxID=6233 RepID=A0A7E4VQE0_PANRE